MTNIIPKVPPEVVVHLGEDTPENLMSAIEGLRRHLDNQHKIVMYEIEGMQAKLAGVLKEVKPSYLPTWLHKAP